MLTVAVCTYNRAERLPALIAALRDQECPIHYELLMVNNNSRDNTVEVLTGLAEQAGPPLRFVTEMKQGIVPARNRAVDEALGSDYVVFMDDDELPLPGMLAAAVDALEREEAECVGGRVRVKFEPYERPTWLGDELLCFLAEVDYGPDPFWITDASTPVWTANVAYRTALFRDGLRYDHRYNREGKGVGGGEDVMMFNALLQRGVRMRFRPDMAVEHFVEPWRLCRTNFLKLHYAEGVKKGLWDLPVSGNTLCGVPFYLFPQTLRKAVRVVAMVLTGRPRVLREAMTASHSCGMIVGTFKRWREG